MNTTMEQTPKELKVGDTAVLIRDLYGGLYERDSQADSSNLRSGEQVVEVEIKKIRTVKLILE